MSRGDKWRHVNYLLHDKSTKAVSYEDQGSHSTARLFQVNMQEISQMFSLLTFVVLRMAAICVLNSVARASTPWKDWLPTRCES